MIVALRVKCVFPLVEYREAKFEINLYNYKALVIKYAHFFMPPPPLAIFSEENYAPRLKYIPSPLTYFMTHTL